MSIIESTPTQRQKKPGTSGVRMFIGVPVCSAYIPEIIMLGGVPIRVQMPPIPEA